MGDIHSVCMHSTWTCRARGAARAEGLHRGASLFGGGNTIGVSVKHYPLGRCGDMLPRCSACFCRS